jgi:thioester reductase-like protein
MIERHLLLELTESYLKSVIAGLCGSRQSDIDSSMPFNELGLDSFRVLKAIKALEADFGTLPKTLMFEHFNIGDLGRYFVDKHERTLHQRFSRESRAGSASNGPGEEPAVKEPVSKQARPQRGPILILERDAYTHPDLCELVKGLFDRYKNEGSVSRGTRNIAPNLFIGSQQKGFFHYGRSKRLLLAYAYTGPIDYFATLARELHEYCSTNNFELNLLAEDEIHSVGDSRFSSTPFGALQRIRELRNFKLDGQAMRRLRYQVSKFAKSGDCRTEEYARGSNQETARQIADMIDRWCAERTMVNPLIHIVKEEILAGTLDAAHRIFLTYVDDVLQNVILISPMSAEHNGYLMDLEFYHKDMPLGGLEFAISKIIEILVAEGCDLLSLGGTYGCKLQSSANADPEVDRILDDLRMQNIFNDSGNLQFKNKFRPENKAIFLCRPVGRCDPHNVIDIIMMIADPLKMQTSDEENHGFAKAVDHGAANVGEAGGPGAHATRGEAVQTSAPVGVAGESRGAILSEFDFNPLNIPHQHIEFDLKTDSWAQLRMPAIENQGRHLHSRLQQSADLEGNLREVFPFAHFALTTSGRTAENVLYRSWPKRGLVPQNLLFPTTLFHQIDKGFTAVELPHPEVFKLDSVDPHKGNLHWAALQQQIERDPGAIALVCIELSNNAAGGCPVSIEHLGRVKALLSTHSVPLVIDATRILENARFLIEEGSEKSANTVWEAARLICSHADVVIASLAKDFCVTGGVIATNDTQLLGRLQATILEEGCGLNVIERKLVALALGDRRYIETQTLRRKESVARLWAALKERGVPVVQPAGGHCVLIDVKQIPEFSAFRDPVASFLAWLYLNTGIRAGAHNVGLQKGTSINDLVRLAVPVGLKPAQMDDVIDRLIALFATKKNIPEVAAAGGARDSMGDLHTGYALIKYHNVSEPGVANVPVSSLAHESPAPEVSVGEIKASVPLVATPTAPTQDIAIVGMSGRYPRASNLHELWENLVQGRDCIETIPEARFEQRLQNRFTRKYRGGFIEDVDRFDARFFNIAPREAEIMDPQERLFLEVAWEAIEEAGYYPESLGGDESARNIGVFVGAVWSSYQILGAEEKIAGNDVNPSSFLWSIANRVSYWMNLTGPSMTLDAACAASLTALKLACDAIRAGECSAAIVGGVNLDLHQSKTDINSTGSSFSLEGVCRSFGKGANGYVSGEGVGALFLKPLTRAIADGDHIHGVIKSAVVAHSGRTNGYMVPSPLPQTRLISKALETAGIDARSVGYIEAHGTGTSLGDSIEIAGLAGAFSKYAVDRRSCSIGCVKTNIGHLEAASGIVGVQKILLQMQHRKLVPSLHSSELNEDIDFTHSPFYVQQKLQDWTVKEVEGVIPPRRAGISAIGAGGTAVHVILEEYADPAQRHEPEGPESAEKIFPLTAKTAPQLRDAALRLRDFLREASPSDSGIDRPNADDIAHTLQLGRKSFDCRLAIIATTTAELVEKLAGFIEGGSDGDILVGNVNNAKAVTAILTTQEKQDFINLLLRGRDPRRLARLWADGVIPDWQGLDIGQKGRKTSLPTYPFAKERYWITNRKSGQPPAATPLEGKPPMTVAEETPPRPVVARRAHKYQFAGTRDHVEPAAKRSSLSIEERARLFVRQLFADQLQIPIDDLDQDACVLDTGITSLDMAEMTHEIKERIDLGFSPTAFFECDSLGAFSSLLAQRYPATFQQLALTRLSGKEPRPAADAGGGKSHAQRASTAGLTKPLHLQDAESDLRLPDDGSVEHTDRTHCVLLAGATGFLGIHTLVEILNSDPDTKVLCIVRAPSRELGLQRVLRQAEKFELAFDVNRLHVMCGDIEEPALGLSEDDWERCCREPEQIVHAAAHVNHIEGYATFRPCTLGMKELIRLAGTYRLKLIQFISSTAVCALKIGDEFSIFEKEDFIGDGAPVYGGYGQSKWVQETLLRRAHVAGIPYVIYRFGELSGSSQTGLGQTDDMLHRLLQMRLAVGCREKISSDVLDMLPVDFAAKLVAGTGKSSQLWNRVMHATHLRPYTLASLYRQAQSRLGMRFAPVTREQYLAKCYDFVRYVYSMNRVNGFVLECVLRDAEGSIRRRKIMDAYFSVMFPFAQENFQGALGVLGLALPDWTALMGRYLDRWSQDECGFIARIFDYQRWADLDEEQRTVHAANNVTELRSLSAERARSRSVTRKSVQDAQVVGERQ